MKKCPYCGAEYPDDALACAIDQTPFESVADSPPPEQKRAEYEFVPLLETDHQKDLVTVVRCRTLTSADTVASMLRALGIAAFLPDECLMQTIAWNVNTYGYVRVQVSPKDYDAARSIISESIRAA